MTKRLQPTPIWCSPQIVEMRRRRWGFRRKYGRRRPKSRRQIIVRLRTNTLSSPPPWGWRWWRWKRCRDYRRPSGRHHFSVRVDRPKLRMRFHFHTQWIVKSVLKVSGILFTLYFVDFQSVNYNPMLHLSRWNHDGDSHWLNSNWNKWRRALWRFTDYILIEKFNLN